MNSLFLQDPFTLVSYPARDWLIRYANIARVRPELAERMVQALEHFEVVPVPEGVMRKLPDVGARGIGGIGGIGGVGTSSEVAGSWFDPWTQPERIRTTRPSPIDQRELAFSYKALVDRMKGFAKAIESGDVGGLSAHVSERYFDRSDSDVGAFTENIKKLVDSSHSRRVIFTEASDLDISGNSISAKVKGAFDIDGETSAFTADVMFEREDGVWKIAAFDMN